MWRLALLLAIVPAGASAAESSPLSNTVDPSKVAPPPPSASQPIQAPDRGAAAPGVQDTAPRFTLARVEFDGATTLSAQVLQPAWTAYAGKSVSLADLHVISKTVERMYAKAGYPFVAVLLTPQSVADGTVRFRVVEGHISSLTVLSNDPIARRQTAAAFGPLVNRTPLSAADTEAAYERAKDVPGLTVGGALRRGGVPGGMDLVVQAKHDDWRIYGNVNNLYPKVVGPWGALIGIDHFGSSPYGDQTSLQLYSSIDGGDQEVVRLTHRQVINAHGTSIEAMALGAWAKPAGAVAPLDLATNVVAFRLAATQPLIDRLRNTMALTLAADYSNQDTKVFSSIGLTNDRLRILSAELTGDLRWAGAAHVGYSLEVRQGFEGFDASNAGDINLSRAGADPQATVGRLSLDAQSIAFHKIRLAGRVEGQVSSGPLTAPEQYAIGNLTIGRGYEPGAAFGDQALAGTGEVRFGPYSYGNFRFQPFGYYDSARLWLKTPGAHREHTVSSVGGGIRVETPGKLHLDLTYAVPLDPPQGLIGESTPTPRLLLSMTVGISDLFKGWRGSARPGVAK